MRKMLVRVRQNVIEDAENPLNFWLITVRHAERVEPAVHGYVWSEWEVGGMSGGEPIRTEVLPKVTYKLLDLKPGAGGPLLERCLLVRRMFPPDELWFPDPQELADSPVFRLPD